MTTSQTQTVESIEQARTIARYWQSAGSIGRTLAAFAAGVSVAWADVIEDAEATIRNDRPEGTDLADLQALVQWASEQPAPTPRKPYANPRDLARIVIVTESVVPLASTIGGKDAVIRYASEILEKRVSEGRMDSRFTPDELRQLIESLLSAEPDMLTWSTTTVRARAGAREWAAADKTTQAVDAMRQGGKRDAIRLLLEAASLAPDLTTEATRGRTVAELLDKLDPAPF